VLHCTTQGPVESRLRVVSNFGDADCGAGKIHTRARKFEEANFRRSLRVASPRTFARERVYFARPTITIAKIRDYSQSKLNPV